MGKILSWIGCILNAIPAIIILICAIASFYVYYNKLYPLTLATPIIFFVIFILWVIGLILKKIENGKKEPN